MPGKRFNYYKFVAFCLIVILIIFGIIFGIISIVKNINYKKSYEYKFIQIGYSVEEEKILEEYFDSKKLNELLIRKYNSNIDDFAKEKYFLYKNLDSYLSYKEDNDSKSFSDIVAIINTEANIEWLDNQKDTDVIKNELMLVNRLYGLKNDFIPDNLVDVPVAYAYSGKKVSGSIIQYIIDLIYEGKDSGYTFVVSSGYRSYSEQESIYNNYVNSYGQIDADELVAKPGHSEYQTGITFDLQPYNKVFEDPYSSEEYDWLSKTAYKYGFILRLQKDKEKLTGFSSSAWKLRYVGVDAATIMYKENLSFEEYYAFYVIGEKNE